MRFMQLSAAKLNLSFRVTKKRDDGYHDIMSLFLRMPDVEALSISKAMGCADDVRARGVEIEGENIVSRALRIAREAGLDTPFLNVGISKTISPGSGLGAGSGNAAAILRWLAGSAIRQEGDPTYPKWQNVALKTGADVPFLFSCHPLALVSGVGEILEPLAPLKFRASIVFPKWSVGTENAYAQLDSRYGECEKYPLSEPEARTEACALHQRLLDGERVGLLPNDFAPMLIEKFPDYLDLFDMFDKSGYAAWGITGSGGAAFALYGVQPPLAVTWPCWSRQVLTLDTA